MLTLADKLDSGQLLMPSHEAVCSTEDLLPWPCTVSTSVKQLH